jgi:hypothetical protein
MADQGQADRMGPPNHLPRPHDFTSQVAIDSATTTALLMLEAFESQAVSFQARVGADACEARKSAADARAQAADLKLTALKQEVGHVPLWT